jgi:hypothetical protein
MTLARLLVAALLLGSLPASAQVTKKGNQFPGGNAFFADDWHPAATPSEPWRLIPKQSAGANSERNPLDRLRINDYKVSQLGSDYLGEMRWPDTDAGMFDASLKPQVDTDTACFSIRSYVVARDSKDSDSTHPVSYSTCVRSDRYHVKSAEIRSESADQ